MKPTDEQDNVITRAGNGENLKVLAYAGCGKTATLTAAARNMRGKGLYIAFNRANAQEAKAKFKGFADAATVHSLAYQAIGHQFHHRIEGEEAGKLSGYRLSEHYNYAPVGPITSLGRASLVRSCLSNWMNSAAPRPEAEHVDVDQAILAAEAAGKALTNKNLLCEVIANDTRRLADELLTNDSLPMPFDYFLKIWVMSKPVLEYDYLLFDEAQDANELFCYLVLSQPMQKILVGDPFQSIYGFRGAANVLQDVDFTACFLSQSFRFGSAIADKANTILRPLGATVPVKGFDTDRSGLGGRTAMIFRGNMSIFSELLTKVLKEKRKVAVVGGTKEMAQILKAVEQLMDGQESSHPDFAGFREWSDYVMAADIPGAPPEMVRLVDMCKRTPVRALRYALQVTGRVKEADAEMVMTTAHKSKGREWPYVELKSDFYIPEEGEDLDEEESRLNYVATTRAQIDLVGAEEMMAAYARLCRIEDGMGDVDSSQAVIKAIAERLPKMTKEQRKSELSKLSAPMRQRLVAHLEETKRNKAHA